VSGARYNFTGEFNSSAEKRAVALWVSVFADDTRPPKLWTTQQSQSSLLILSPSKSPHILQDVAMFDGNVLNSC
jgi:hypothetical protein